ncbi:hypothetical protein T484DRAFT_2317934 [Baffinella frigidus]|nr:hypothetical protein T484DRAFT_2317934 [Cryptophyta sp. CCMP2293]
MICCGKEGSVSLPSSCLSPAPFRSTSSSVDRGGSSGFAAWSCACCLTRCRDGKGFVGQTMVLACHALRGLCSICKCAAHISGHRKKLTLFVCPLSSVRHYPPVRPDGGGAPRPVPPPLPFLQSLGAHPLSLSHPLCLCLSPALSHLGEVRPVPSSPRYSLNKAPLELSEPSLNEARLELLEPVPSLPTRPPDLQTHTNLSLSRSQCPPPTHPFPAPTNPRPRA